MFSSDKVYGLLLVQELHINNAICLFLARIIFRNILNGNRKFKKSAIIFTSVIQLTEI